MTGGAASAGGGVAPMGELSKLLGLGTTGAEVIPAGTSPEAVTTPTGELSGPAGGESTGGESTGGASAGGEAAGGEAAGGEAAGGEAAGGEAAGTTGGEAAGGEPAGGGLAVFTGGGDETVAGVGTKVIVLGTLVMIPGFWLT